MKIAKYRRMDGTYLEIEYDETAPCWSCGFPVISASMGGTTLCPWCDMGIHRDGRKMTIMETIELGRTWRENVRKHGLGDQVISEEEAEDRISQMKFMGIIQ